MQNRANRPRANQEVSIADSSGTRFAGIIVNPVEMEVVTGNGFSEFMYDVQCQDYRFWLDRRRHVGFYQATTAGAIIRAVIAADPNNTFTTAGVQNGVQINFIAFNYEQPSQILARLAQATGYYWWVGFDKDIKFVPKLTSNAPFRLDSTISSETSTATRRFRALTIHEDISQLQNDVFVRGGIYFSQTQNDSFTGDGVARAFNMRYGTPVVGSLTLIVGGVAQVVADEGSAGATTSAWIVNYKDKVVKAATGTTTPGSGVVITLNYQYTVPVLANLQNLDSINNFGGDPGGRFQNVIIDQAISSNQLASQVAQRALDVFGKAQRPITFITTKDGLSAGQTITVNVPERDLINAAYIIKEVRAQLLGVSFDTGGPFYRWQYDVQAY